MLIGFAMGLESQIIEILIHPYPLCQHAPVKKQSPSQHREYNYSF